MRHTTPLQMRFGDTDALGHINNAAFAQYAEAGRLGFLAELGVDVTSIILANLSIDFRSQARFGERLDIETRVERVGQTSVTLFQTVNANGRVSAELRSVVVLYDYELRSPRAIPAPLREQLERYRTERT